MTVKKKQFKYEIVRQQLKTNQNIFKILSCLENANIVKQPVKIAS